MCKRFSLVKTSFISILLIIGFVFLQSCDDDKRLKPEIKEIPVTLNVDRFDVRFANATKDSIPGLIKAYPFLFPQQYETGFWEKKIQDTLQESLETEVQEQFPDFNQEQEDLETLFKHIKFYYPKTQVPKVITVTSDVDYRNKVILTDSLLIVALDTYLGSDHRFYDGIQRYLVQNFTKEQLDVDVASAFAQQVLGNRPAGRRFIDEMVHQGKRLYLMQHLLSLEEPYTIMGYTKEQWDWAERNEVNIWTYFIEHSLLFSTDRDLLGRFINEAPFSKFYMELDTEAPPKLGAYIGWQMVKAYAENQNLNLQEIMKKDTDTVFENANYKPKK